MTSPSITEVCDRIIVMYAGQVVEEGDDGDDHHRAAAPLHPGTAGRAAAGQASRSAEQHPWRPPSLIDVPAGCRFAPRCPYRVAECLSWDTELLSRASAITRPAAGDTDEVGKSPA